MNLFKHHLTLLTMISVFTTTTLFSLEEENQNQQAEVKVIIANIDEMLCDIAQKYPDNMTQDEIDSAVDANFYAFYKLTTKAKPKKLTSTLILFLQYCELIFQHGSVSKIIATMPTEQREIMLEAFIFAWEELLKNAVDQLENSVHNVVINIPQPSNTDIL